MVPYDVVKSFKVSSRLISLETMKGKASNPEKYLIWATSQSIVGVIPSGDASNMLPSVKITTDLGLRVIVSATVASFSIYSQTPPTPGEYAIDRILRFTTLFIS